MVNYKDLGLVNTRELFKKAVAGGYAIPAYNFNNMEQLQAIIQACVDTKSPVILQVSAGARKYANKTLLRYMAQGAVEYAKELGYAIPVVLHLDHGDTFELCKDCIESGFSSVMIDGSHHPYEKNVELTKQVVEYAHKHDVSVEGELGVLAGVEDEVSSEHTHYTKPEEVEDFVKKTGVDSLAIQSELLMERQNSNQSSAHAMQTVFLFRLIFALTFSKKLKNEFPDSRLFFTDHHLFQWIWLK
jgi:fructose-bisphosphate aldolase, class II